MLSSNALRSAHGVVELLERDVESGQRAFLDGAVLEAVQRIAQDTVSLGLHLVEFFGGIAAARGATHRPAAVRAAS